MSSRPEHGLTQVLDEIQQLHRELLEQRYLRRADATERVREAVRRLGEIGSPAGIIARAAEELGTSSEFDVVLISRIADGQIRAQSLWSRQGQVDSDHALAELERQSIPLRYPLIEADVVQSHQAASVSVSDSGGRAAPDLAEILGWSSYAVTNITLEGSTVGLLHAGLTGAQRELDPMDLELAALYAVGLGQAFERAMLREQLQQHRVQLQSAAQWVNAQMLDLATQANPSTTATAAGDDRDLVDLLTPRELEVMRLIARGHSNRAIATSLTLGEGTIKYHVKNILRKLQARSRTEAISRYVQLAGSGDGS